MDSSEQRLFSEQTYGLYLLFLGVMFLVVSMFKLEFKAVSVTNTVGISLILSFINFSFAWCAMVSAPGVAYSHPVSFNIIFYTTMIAAPGFALYSLETIREALIAYDNYLPM